MHTANNPNITISYHHIKATPSLEQKINETIVDLQNKFNKFQHITSIHVTLKIDSTHNHNMHNQIAEAEITISGKKDPIFAQAISEDLYKSLSKLKNKLKRQIVKYKETLVAHGEQHHNNYPQAEYVAGYDQRNFINDQE